MKTRIPYSTHTFAQKACIILLACGTLLCGCKKRPFSRPESDQPAYLSIAKANWSNGSSHIVANTTPDSKAFNSGNGLSTQFSEGDRLGLFLRGDSYEPVDNRMVTYTPEEGDIITKWVIDGDPITLYQNEATLTAYFPYSEYGKLLMDSIPLVAGAYDVNTNDVVWQRDKVHSTHTQAMFLNMQHAMTRVKLLFSKKPATDPTTYLGAGKIEAVQIADANTVTEEDQVIYVDGFLNLETETPTILPAVRGRVIISETKTLSEEGVLYDFLLLPVANINPGAVQLHILIDDKTITTEFPTSLINAWKAGTAYTYEITVRNGDSQVVFGKVGTTPWNYGGKISGDLDPSNPEYGGGDVEDWGNNGWGVEIDGNQNIDIDIDGNFVVSADPGGMMTWENAIIYCQNKGLNWRLPTQNELMYLRCIAPSFTGNVAFKPTAHWAATQNLTDHTLAWHVDISNGRTSSRYYKYNQFAARCIKDKQTSGQTYPFITTASDGGVVIVLQDNNGGVDEASLFPDKLTASATGNETTTDNRMSRKFRVQKNQNSTKLTWADAVSYCDNLVEENCDNWRLPSQRELMLIWTMGGNSTVSEGNVNDTGVGDNSTKPISSSYLYQQSDFTAFVADYYWPATQYSLDNNNAWGVTFNNAYTTYDRKKIDSYNVRCVRDEW